MEYVEVTQQHDRNKHARMPQYVATLSATIGALSVGAALGYSSPASLQISRYSNLSNHTNTSSAANTSNSEMRIFDELRLTEGQMAWVSSVINLGAMWGGICGGTALNIFGRRGTMMLSVIPAVIGWLLIGLEVTLSMLMIGRALTGVFAGLACVSVNTYIGEFASPDMRGKLGMMFQLMANIGFLYSYSLGVLLEWHFLAFADAVIPLVFGVAMFFMRESPAYLLRKGRENEAKEAMQHFRGPHYCVEAELQALRASQHASLRHKVQWADLRKPYIARPLLISLMLMFFQQLSGANAVLFNVATIFKSAGTDLSVAVGSIVVGSVFVAGTFVGSLLIDRMGRRVLLTVSALMMGVAHVGLGVFFFELEQHREWTLQQLQWLPLTALVTYILGLAVGFAPVPWVMMGELFSPKIREIASSSATATSWLLSFVVTVSFQRLQNTIHDYGVYWLFSAMCFLAAIFSLTVVKETKGKSLEEITVMFGGPAAEEKPSEDDAETTLQSGD